MDTCLEIESPYVAIPFLTDEAGGILASEDGQALFTRAFAAKLSLVLPTLMVRRTSMKHWFEAGPITVPDTTEMAHVVGVTTLGLTAPSVVATRAYDITDKRAEQNVSADVLSGGASISTTQWVTPLITPASTHRKYRVETDILDSGNTITLVLFVNVVY